MREHPIPQDITNYRFHIIGSMTLKQFAEIFLGVIAAIIIYSTNLPDVIKWPLIAISVGLGAAAAFVPIEERPLDHWIITFFRVLYKPTRFFWKREPHIPEPFAYVPRSDQQNLEPELDLTPAKRARIKEYITSVNTPSEYQTDLTDWETNRMQQITEIFSTELVATPPATVKKQIPQVKPNVTVRVRSLRSGSVSADGQTNQTSQVSQTGQTNQENQPDSADNQAEEITIYANTTIQQAPPLEAPQPTSQPTSPPETPPAEQKPEGTNYPERVGNIPRVSQPQIESPPEAEPQEQAVEEARPAYAYVQNQAMAPKEERQTSGAAFNLDLPFPDPPTEPNKIVGMVQTPNNELITSAIVEIQTESGQIVRAVKTNALGQFFITTPLNNGTYVVSVEKDGYTFVPQKIVLSGEPVAPLEFRST